jgi:hypothetical protein
MAPTWCIVVCCSAMYGATAWRGVARPAGSAFVRYGFDGVGSARQAFQQASAFNQNIGSWNIASVTTMFFVRALVPWHACGAQPTSLLAKVVPAQLVPAQMLRWPSSDVGESRRRCGLVQAQMWARLGSPVNEPCVF